MYRVSKHDLRFILGTLVFRLLPCLTVPVAVSGPHSKLQ
jgi:hypothetical protein